jgi:hypothetical protein
MLYEDLCVSSFLLHPAVTRGTDESGVDSTGSGKAQYLAAPKNTRTEIRIRTNFRKVYLAVANNSRTEIRTPNRNGSGAIMQK